MVATTTSRGPVFWLEIPTFPTGKTPSKNPPYTPMLNPRALGFPLPMARQGVRLHPPSWMTSHQLRLGEKNAHLKTNEQTNLDQPNQLTNQPNQLTSPILCCHRFCFFLDTCEGIFCWWNKASDDKKPCIVNIRRVFCILQHRSWRHKCGMPKTLITFRCMIIRVSAESNSY